MKKPVTAELPKEIQQEPYMNPAQLAYFGKQLDTLLAETVHRIQVAQAELSNKPELNDAADQASFEEETAIALRIVERETRLLGKIKLALVRVRDGSYGYCQASGEPIGVARLLIRPTAEYCAEVKDQLETKERHYGKRH